MLNQSRDGFKQPQGDGNCNDKKEMDCIDAIDGDRVEAYRRTEGRGLLVCA